MLGKYAEGASLSQSSGVQISRNGGSCPSPSGRRWPEGPDEGAFPALTRRFAPPSPKGRGTCPKQVCFWSEPHFVILTRVAFMFGISVRLTRITAIFFSSHFA